MGLGVTHKLGRRGAVAQAHRSLSMGPVVQAKKRRYVRGADGSLDSAGRQLSKQQTYAK